MRFAFVIVASASFACATTSTTPTHTTTTTTTPATTATTATTYASVHIDATRFLAVPPTEDSEQEQSDLAAVKRAQKAKGTDRWVQAQHDDDPSPFAAFANVLGPSFTADKAPKTAALFKVLFDDTSAQTRPSKNAFARRRPPLVDNAIETCAPLEKTPSYPSGHAARGWMMALVLADMLPEKSDALLARGRDYGDSRVVCGEHFPSDVEAGRLIGAAVFASAQESDAFRRDEQAARAELRTLLGVSQ